MKKLLLIIFTLSFFQILTAENLVTASAGLLTGYPFYGSKEIKQHNELLTDSNRILIGTLEAINLNIVEQAAFFLGADVLCDFNWKKSHFSNHVSVDFPLGVKIYPDLGGFAVGLAYCVGVRTSFTKKSDEKMDIGFSSWGNGIKLLMEYNFSHTDSKYKYIPTLGLYWKFMPRGNNSYDNHICAYLQQNF